MSLLIDRREVSRVMIGNEWVECIAYSFIIEEYQYVYGDKGQYFNHEIVHINEYGFGFNRKSDGRSVFGPMSSLQAVEYDNGYDKDEA